MMFWDSYRASHFGLRKCAQELVARLRKCAQELVARLRKCAQELVARLRKSTCTIEGVVEGRGR